MRRSRVVQQVQVGQQLLGGRVFGQGKTPRSTRERAERRNAFAIQIGEGCSGTGRRIERPRANQLAVFEVLHQGGIQAADQLVSRGETAADELRFGLRYQRLRFGLTLGVAGALDEDEPGLPLLGSPIELALGRRDSLVVLEAVVASEQAEVDITPIHLAQVNLVGASVPRRQILEEEDREEPAQQGIALDEVAYRASFFRELLLNAADEDALHHVRSVRARTLCKPPVLLVGTCKEWFRRGGMIA